MRSLAAKLTLAFVAVGVAGIAIIAVMASRATRREFFSYADEQARLAFVQRLEESYLANGSWEGLQAELAEPASNGTVATRRPAVVSNEGVVVSPSERWAVGDRPPTDVLERGAPLEFEGQRVGTLLVEPPGDRPPGDGGEFIGRMQRDLLFGVAGGILVALALGFVLSRTLTRPMRAMTEATQAIAAGDYSVRVSVGPRDELGQLAESFNQMSSELARSRYLRQQLTADVAHELRTPLGVILGHAEALSDGVLPPTQETFALIHEETLRLNRIVEDLRTLSLTDAGEISIERIACELPPLLQRAVRTAQGDAQSQGLRLEIQTGPDLPKLVLDPDRMAQVLDNLLRNALLHSPPESRILLSAFRVGWEVVLTVQDEGAGVAQQNLSRIFDRFFREEAARPRDSGGSGLGLAIARSLVEAQGGRMWAESPAQGGFSVHMAFPAPAPTQDSGH
jgi:two-component system sensor histidine kinase BaeS